MRWEVGKDPKTPPELAQTKMAPVVVIALLFAVPLLLLYRRFVRRAPHPPGPPGLPLVGNVRDIPAPHDYPWLKYRKWCREYSEFIR